MEEVNNIKRLVAQLAPLCESMATKGEGPHVVLQRLLNPIAGYLMPIPLGPMLHPETIKSAISRVTGVTWSAIENSVNTKKQPWPQIRFMCMYFFHMFTDMSLKNIGASFGEGRKYDHTSIMHGIKTILIDRTTSVNINETMKAITDLLELEQTEASQAIYFHTEKLETA